MLDLIEKLLFEVLQEADQRNGDVFLMLFQRIEQAVENEKKQILHDYHDGKICSHSCYKQLYFAFKKAWYRTKKSIRFYEWEVGDHVRVATLEEKLGKFKMAWMQYRHDYRQLARCGVCSVCLTDNQLIWRRVTPASFSPERSVPSEREQRRDKHPGFCQYPAGYC
jgi:hypothetical protein